MQDLLRLISSRFALDKSSYATVRVTVSTVISPTHVVHVVRQIYVVIIFVERNIRAPLCVQACCALTTPSQILAPIFFANNTVVFVRSN
jgi:hypothetical protein